MTNTLNKQVKKCSMHPPGDVAAAGCLRMLAALRQPQA